MSAVIESLTDRARYAIEHPDVLHTPEMYRGIVAELLEQRDELLALLIRYRNETPIGHQPHMIVHEVDAAIATVIGGDA